MKQVDEGVVLHKKAYSESSLITTIFTKNHGLKSFIYKGAKKKNHQLFPLSLVEITYYGRPESDLLNLTEMEPLSNWSFQFNPIKGSVAFFIAELSSLCIQSEERDEDLYLFLSSFVQRLDDQNSIGPIPLEFMVQLTKYLGFAPLIEDRSFNYFNLEAGTFQGGAASKEHLVIEGKSIELIKNILLDEQIVVRDKSTRKEALKIMLDYYQIHVPGYKPLKSIAVLETVLAE